jgi:hypothetical protein|nr:MAG TPA: hypothetical protein [Caudoviricetes sp.]
MLIKIDDQYINTEQIESLRIVPDTFAYIVYVNTKKDNNSIAFTKCSSFERAKKAMDELAETINAAN